MAKKEPDMDDNRWTVFIGKEIFCNAHLFKLDYKTNDELSKV